VDELNDIDGVFELMQERNLIQPLWDRFKGLIKKHRPRAPDMHSDWSAYEDMLDH